VSSVLRSALIAVRQLTHVLDAQEVFIYEKPSVWKTALMEQLELEIYVKIARGALHARGM